MQKTDIIKINSILFNIEKRNKMYGIEKVEDIFLILQGYSMADENHNYDYFFKEFTMFVRNDFDFKYEFANWSRIIRFFSADNEDSLKIFFRLWKLYST